MLYEMLALQQRCLYELAQGAPVRYGRSCDDVRFLPGFLRACDAKALGYRLEHLTRPQY